MLSFFVLDILLEILVHWGTLVVTFVDQLDAVAEFID